MGILNELRIQATNRQDFWVWCRQLAENIVNYLAVDTGVRLAGDTIEGFNVPADSYGEVVDALGKGLHVTLAAVGNRQPLELPCSLALIELMTHQIFAPFSDTRGFVKLEMQMDSEKELEEKEVAIWEAVFGPQGWFSLHRGHDVVTSDHYLRSDGTYKNSTFYVGKDANVHSSSERLSPSLTERTFNHACKVLRTHDGSGDQLYKMNDAHVDHITGLAFLVPAFVFSAADTDLLQGRMIKYDNPQEDANMNTSQYYTSYDVSALRCAHWLVNAKKHGLCLRGTIILTPNQGMCFDMQRTLFAALSEHNKRDSLAEIAALPNHSLMLKLFNICLMVFNPFLSSNWDNHADTTDEKMTKLDLYHQLVRELTVTLAMSESFRSHISCFTPFANYNDPNSGFIQNLFIGSFGEDQHFPDPFDRHFVITKNDDDTNLVEYYKTEAVDDVDLHNLLRDTVKRVNHLMSEFSNLVQTGPAISYDNNRVSISPKYTIGAIASAPGRTSALDVPFNDDATPEASGRYEVLQEGLSRLFCRVYNPHEFLDFLPCAGGSIDMDKVNGDLPHWQELSESHLLHLKCFVTYEEYSRGALEVLASGPDATGGEPISVVADQWVLDLYEILFEHFNIEAGTESCLVMYTKVDGIERVANYLSDMYYVPILYEQPTDDQLLGLLGYSVCEIITTPKYTEICQSNQKNPDDPDMPLTPSGVFLKEVGRAGGFGFAQILGPLLGTGAKALVTALAGEEAGSAVGGIVEGVAGVLPF